MHRRRVATLGLAVLAIAGAAWLTACGSSGGTDAPGGGVVEAPIPDGGATSDASNSDGSQDIDGGDGGDGSTDPLPTCATSIAVGAGAKLAASTADDDLGLSVTLDELSAAWITVSGGTVTIHYVDRAAATDAFGPEQTTTGAFAAERVALTPDGLSLAAVNMDGLGFSMMTRGARGDAFGAPSAGPFTNLNDQGATNFAVGERYGDPLFARNGSYFLFSRYGGVDDAGVKETTTVYLGTTIPGFPGSPYSPGSPYAAAALTGNGTQRKIVTGASDDIRTLFVYDQAAAKSRIVVLDAPGNVVSSSDVGTMRDLQPSTSCKVFYYVQGTPGDLFRYAAP